MENYITLGVFRRLDNRLEGLSDDSKRALELHNLRKETLHEVLDNQEIFQVIDWGFTDDTQSHEYVEIVLGVIATTVIQPLIIKGLKALGKKLAEKAIDEATSEFIKWIISKLTKKQKEQKILDFNIKLPDGTLFKIDPPQGKSEITINFSNGEMASVKYQINKG